MRSAKRAWRRLVLELRDDLPLVAPMKRRPKAPSAAALPLPKPTRADRLRLEREERDSLVLRRGELRHDVLVRADFRCENPDCRADLARTGMAWDHWLGGSGRRAQREAEATTWILCTRCNEERTLNVPCASTWNDRFERHCTLHGYRFEPHITRLQQFNRIAESTT